MAKNTLFCCMGQNGSFFLTYKNYPLYPGQFFFIKQFGINHILFYGVQNVRYNSFFIGRKNRKMFFFMDSQISQYSFWVLLMLPFLSWEKIILYYVRYSVAKFITTQFCVLIILFLYANFCKLFFISLWFFFG